MPNVILKVTLNEAKGYLDVDEAGNGNQIAHGQNDTVIWQLTGNAASGTFNAMNAQTPGFEWVQDPPNGVFGTPALQASGNEVQISDNNTDPNGINSSGEWVYQIAATIDGEVYSTQTTLGPGGNTTDPTIHNL